MGDPGRVLIYADLEALSEAAARLFATEAAQAISQRGRFVVALSGGVTPRRTYELLGGPPFLELVPWPQVHFFWGDERSIPLGEPGSNYRLAKEALLDRVPVNPENVHPLPAYPAVELGAQREEAYLRAFFGQGPPSFDLVLLGLGRDGHTASLFPGTQAVKETRRWVAPVIIPGQEVARLTLTPRVINQGAIIVFLVAGAAKAKALREVLEGPREPQRFPAQFIQPVAGKLLWLVDRQAAALLTVGSYA